MRYTTTNPDWMARCPMCARPVTRVAGVHRVYECAGCPEDVGDAVRALDAARHSYVNKEAELAKRETEVQRREALVKAGADAIEEVSRRAAQAEAHAAGLIKDLEAWKRLSGDQARALVASRRLHKSAEKKLAASEKRVRELLLANRWVPHKQEAEVLADLGAAMSGLASLVGRKR